MRFPIYLNSFGSQFIVMCQAHKTNYGPSAFKGGTDKGERQGEIITRVNVEPDSQLLGRS